MTFQIEENVNEKTPGWSFWLIVVGVVTTFGGSLPVGYNIGVVNAPADIICQFCNDSITQRYDFPISKSMLDIVWSSIVSVFLVGGVIGSLSGSWLANKLGRKGAYITTNFLHLSGALLFYAAKPLNLWELLLVGRIIVGLAAGLITCIVPMYLTELAPLHLRGSLGVLCPLGVCTGVLVAQALGLRQVLGTEENWPILLSLYVFLVISCGTILAFIPESPKYLAVVKRKPQKALIVLSKLRGLSPRSLAIEQEMDELQDQLRNADSSTVQWNLKSVIKSKELLLPVLLVCSMQGGQQLSGINVVFYYSVSIFQKTGLNEQEAQLANIGCGGINLLMAILAIPLMARYNRRTLFLLSSITAASCLILLAAAIALLHYYSWMSYISIIAMLSYVFCYGIGLGPIPYFIGSELFEVGPRSSAMALGSMASWGGNFLVAMTFPTMQRYIGSGGFGIFAVITLALFFFIRRYFPETRGVDPSEVALLCKDGFHSRPMSTPTNSGSSEETTPTNGRTNQSR